MFTVSTFMHLLDNKTATTTLFKDKTDALAYISKLDNDSFAWGVLEGPNTEEDFYAD